MNWKTGYLKAVLLKLWPAGQKWPAFRLDTKMVLKVLRPLFLAPGLKYLRSTVLQYFVQAILIELKAR